MQNLKNDTEKIQKLARPMDATTFGGIAHYDYCESVVNSLSSKVVLRTDEACNEY